MLELKRTSTHRWVMKGYEYLNDLLMQVSVKIPMLQPSTEIIFSGLRSELKEKNEEFWKEIYKYEYQSSLDQFRRYPIFGGGKRLSCKSAKESGHSTLEIIKEENILIVREKL